MSIEKRLEPPDETVTLYQAVVIERRRRTSTETSKKYNQLISIAADKSEIGRLRGELDACHNAYLQQGKKLAGLRQEIRTLSIQMELKDDAMSKELLKWTAQIDELRREFNRQAPRLEAAREFFGRMT
jgi:uncharacterized coiled-coil DUF342 family protein